MFRWKLSHLAHFASLATIAILALSAPVSRAEEPTLKPIRIALYADQGATIKSLPEVINTLPPTGGFAVSKISADEIRHSALDQYDVVIFPGGSGSGEGNALSADGRSSVRSFVTHGGGYIGICAGAYLASIEYPWSLGLLNARVLDRPHWDRGTGDVGLKFSAAGKESLHADADTCTIHYENGPLLGPGQREGMQNYELLASYDTEMTQNAPAGMMKGTAAIARGKFGDGRVVCFSPHPEKTAGRAVFLQSAVRWGAQRDIKNQ
ncbi:MAG TPA: BPL-N domain-containing protein [Lacipirellulaceae bacterium]|nr:BPL-N domain-containing protein [Lacipirellulaceae bacterium]